MKILKIVLLIPLVLTLANPLFADEGVNYDKLVKILRFAKKKDIRGVRHGALYLKSKKEMDFTKANFRMTSEDGGVLKINYERLEKIPLEKRNSEDIDQIEEGFQLKLWVPIDAKKYRGWVLKHDLEKDSLTVAVVRVLTIRSIKKKRADDAEKAEQNGADRPATAPKSKSEGKMAAFLSSIMRCWKKPFSKSEIRGQQK